MLEVENIAAGYGAIKILKGVSLTVEKGEIVGVIGANGAGKTTLASCISGILSISSGRIIFEGREIHRLSPDRIVGMRIIYVPEGRHIFAPFTVYENLVLGCYPRYKQLGSDGREKLLKRVFDLFPILCERKEQHGGSLSGGEQQMLAIARALMAEPKFLMSDEPSLGLAPLIFATVCDALKKINEEGVTVLLVEQNARATLNLSKRIYVFENGHVVAQGASQDFTVQRLKELYIA
ncbi:MAG: ABC transporter ATP-binding protein [Thermodesulfobacteriota bacterium]